jgi:hypothetical protein
MKVKTALMVAALFVGLNGAAHAVTMIAGPLSGDSCSCYIVNVTTSSKTVEIVGLNKGGVAMVDVTKTLGAAVADGVTIGTASVQYCKFINASPTNFRAAIQCVNGTTNEMFALPAR